MKLGNVSQTIASVPDFYLNRMGRKLDSFVLPRRKRLYRESDLVSSLRDINICHNPRVSNSKEKEISSEKYLPCYSKCFSQVKTNATDKTRSEGIRAFNYREKEEVAYQQLRNEIKENISNLIDKINCSIDLKRWSKFNSKVPFNNFYKTNYSVLSDYIRNKKTVRDEFNAMLKGKTLSLRTINPKARSSIIMQRQEKSKHLTDAKMTTVNKDIDAIIDTCKSNLLELKAQNMDSFEYNKEDELLIKENQYLYDRGKSSTLYKQFPSANRMEFAIKKIPKKRHMLFANGKQMMQTNSQPNGVACKNLRRDFLKNEMQPNCF